MERKYRILGIAPYENLKNAMVTEAAKYEDIEMVVYTGNLEDGAQLALQHMNEGFDILISRGGTAELIRKIASIPVIEITPLSFRIKIDAVPSMTSCARSCWWET